MDKVEPYTHIVYAFPREHIEIVWKGRDTMLVRPYGQVHGHLDVIDLGGAIPTQAGAYDIATAYVRKRSYHA